MKNLNENFCAALGAVAVLMTVCCGLPALPATNGELLSPYVTAVAPVEGSELTEFPRVTLQFSRPLSPDTVTDENIFLISAADYAGYDDNEWRDLKNDIGDGDAVTLPTQVTLSADGLSLSVEASPTVMPVPGSAEEFVVVALPTLLSVDRYPLNQAVAGTDSPVFASRFWIRNPARTNSADFDDPASAYPDDAGTTVDDAEENVSSTPDTASDSTTTTPFEADDEDGGLESGEATSASPESLPEPDFNRVMITEIVTDPQQDHNDTSGGDGVKFDGIPGNGTVGSTDEYVEIYNGADTPLNLTGWSLSMLDGSDVIQTIDETGWDLYFSGQGQMSSFDAGEVLVLGNPEGDLKNTVTVELRDGAGELRDSVFVEDGNAQGLADESFRIDDQGLWEQGEATPALFEY